MKYGETLRNKYKNCYVIFGGSTVATGIIPSQIEQNHNVPIINAGSNLGIGGALITRLALEQVRSGDTILVALEPPVLAHYNDVMTKQASDFFVAQNGLDFNKNNFFELEIQHAIEYIQGDTRYFVYMWMKRILNMPLFRYVNEENISLDGWLEVKEQRPLPPVMKNPAPVVATQLSETGRAYLLKLKQFAETIDTDICYVFPTMYRPNINAKYSNAALALEILEIMPIIKDADFGISTNHALFADTQQHPLKLESQRISHNLGMALKNNIFWDKLELMAILEEAKRDNSFIEESIVLE
jgi:hypothetical protein